MTTKARYCETRQLHPQEAMEHVDTKRLHNFFFWVLSYRKKTLRAKGTLETYWKVFCLVRERRVGGKLDKLVVRQMHGVSLVASTTVDECILRAAKGLAKIGYRLWLADEEERKGRNAC